MKSNYFIVSSIVAALFVTGCSHRAPIYNVENHPMPYAAQQLTNQEIGNRIRTVVAKRNWHCDQTTPNSLLCYVDRRTHEARVRVDYDQRCFSIHYVDTHNLGKKGCEVNNKYNKWVKLMEKDIVKAMSQGKCPQ